MSKMEERPLRTTDRLGIDMVVLSFKIAQNQNFVVDRNMRTMCKQFVSSNLWIYLILKEMPKLKSSCFFATSPLQNLTAAVPLKERKSNLDPRIFPKILGGKNSWWFPSFIRLNRSWDSFFQKPSNKKSQHVSSLKKRGKMLLCVVLGVPKSLTYLSRKPLGPRKSANTIGTTRLQKKKRQGRSTGLQTAATPFSTKISFSQTLGPYPHKNWIFFVEKFVLPRVSWTYLIATFEPFQIQLVKGRQVVNILTFEW